MKGIYYYVDLKTSLIDYIGRTNDLDRRHKQHLQPSEYDKQQFNRVLQNNPNRYKYCVFVKGNFTQKVLSWLEKKYIAKYNPRFNFTEGGDGGLSGFKHSEETKQKISEAQKGEKNHMYGKSLSDEHKIKCSKSKNTTGYYGVYIQKNDAYTQGYCYVYQYYEEGKRKRLSSVNLNKLKNKVINNNLLWKKL